MDYIQKIRNLMDEKKIKNKDMAEVLNVSNNTLANWLNLRNPMPVPGYLSICEYFEVPPAYFFNSEKKPINYSKTQLSELQELKKENNMLKNQMSLLKDKLILAYEKLSSLPESNKMFNKNIS